ncbi:helix-turn-helix transcriptional regulator [Ureibacillus sp. Re31]|uniref:Helix-turn-helix transcriptional regulator n=1 Tax=Ureibacillus galli TaxID=2762222 RepID=A0ABR8XBA1_9BACL|nr:helix-turn-helix transcriptional regulator [Ureibacillus galli]
MERVRKVTANRVGTVLKEIRGEQTQQQFAFDMGVVRETVSKYETGRSHIPQDISRKITQKYDNPKFAITIRNEYTGTGPKWLNGQNVDLHRSSVKEKTVEELQEALDAISNTSLAKPFRKLKLFDYQNVEEVLLEAAEAMTALEHFIAVVCSEANISYTNLWDKHYRELANSGYITT